MTAEPVGDVILQTVGLGAQWPTVDPFLFCAHHDDRYPAGNGRLGPDAPLAGRSIGSDFAGVDGWNMYHGRTVPGFPQHPHRGFETVSVVRRGFMDHADSLGATARFSAGDVQWMTAGAGIVHSEMFPLFDTAGPNPLEMFQVWVNLPARSKMVAPYFTMMWDGDIPRVHQGGATVTVVAGRLADARPLAPPPDSWASDPRSGLAIWHLELPGGAEFTLPAADHPDTGRVIYLYRGTGGLVGGTAIDAPTGVVVRSETAVTLAAAAGDVSCLVLQGRPIGEPVVQYGPFVMNTRAEIEQAFLDYRRTGFGGWPWPADDPVHGTGPERFALHPDGRLERPVSVASPTPDQTRPPGRSAAVRQTGAGPGSLRSTR